MAFLSRHPRPRAAVLVTAAAILLPAAYAAAASTGPVYKGYITGEQPEGAVTLRLSASRGKVLSFSVRFDFGCFHVGAGYRSVKSQARVTIAHGKFSTSQTGTAPMPFVSPPEYGTYKATISGKLTHDNHDLNGRFKYVLTKGQSVCFAAANSAGKPTAIGYTTKEN